jgi:SAM-dependent methyltransferase
MLWQSPVPTLAFLEAAYPPDYRPHVVEAGLLSRLKRIQASLQGRQLARLLPGRSATILEIGCGSGFLIRELSRRGFENLSAVDQNPHLAALFEGTAIRFQAANLETSPPSELGQAGSFDCIILINVIEHFLEPERVLLGLFRLLKPQGQVLLMTPNADSLSHRIFGACWSGLHVPRHPQVFAPQAVSLLGKRCGFSEVSILPCVDVSSWAFSFQNWLGSKWRAARPRKAGTAWYSLVLLPFWYPFAWLEKSLGKPSSILVLLKKR